VAYFNHLKDTDSDRYHAS